MKYIEAEKKIKALSSKYSINMEDGDFDVLYNRKTYAAYVSNDYEYGLHVGSFLSFSKLPFSRKLYMILAELAITPLDEREEENKYYVKIGDSIFSYLNIYTVTNKTLMMVGDTCETKFIKTKFTNKEIEQLKQRDDIPLDWNKVTLEEAK